MTPTPHLDPSVTPASTAVADLTAVDDVAAARARRQWWAGVQCDVSALLTDAARPDPTTRLAG